MRQVSWFLGTAALVVPPLWARHEMTVVYEQARAEGIDVCGLPALAIMMAACMGCVVLSGAAVVLGVVARPALPMVPSLAFLGLITLLGG